MRTQNKTHCNLIWLEILVNRQHLLVKLYVYTFMLKRFSQLWSRLRQNDGLGVRGSENDKTARGFGYGRSGCRQLRSHFRQGNDFCSAAETRTRIAQRRRSTLESQAKNIQETLPASGTDHHPSGDWAPDLRKMFERSPFTIFPVPRTSFHFRPKIHQRRTDRRAHGALQARDVSRHLKDRNRSTFEIGRRHDRKRCKSP